MHRGCDGRGRGARAPARRTCERLLVEPARNVDRFLLWIDQAGTKQPRRIDLAVRHAFDPGAGVEPAETRFQCGSVAVQIGLGDQQPVRKRHLLHRFILMVELMRRVDGIDRRTRLISRIR